MIILPVSVLSIIFIFFVHGMLFNELEARFIDNLENSTESYASLINARLDKLSEVVSIKADDLNNNSNLNQDQINKTIADILNYDSLIFGSSVFLDTLYPGKLASSFYYTYNQNGINNKISYNKHDIEYDAIFRSNLSWLHDPIKNRKGTWTSPYFDEGIGNVFMITYAEPLIIKDQIVGVITIDIQIRDVEKLLHAREKEIEGEYNPFLIIINNADSIIAYAERSFMIGEYIYDYEYNDDYNEKNTLNFDSIFAQKKGAGIIHSSTDEQYLYVFFAPIISADWTAINIIDISLAAKKINNTLFNVIVVMIIAMIGIIIIVYLTSQMITKPITKLSKLSVDIANGNYKNKVTIKGNDEIGKLASNFNTMVSEVENRESALQISNNSLEKATLQLQTLDTAKNDFLQLISHEIRTPLNGIVGSAHFLNDIIEDPELKDFLDMLKESVNRLDSFSQTALEITEMQTVGDKETKTNFQVIPPILEIIESEKNNLIEKRLTIKTNFCDIDNLFGIERYYIRCIKELVINAIKYSHNDSTINISTFVEDNKFKILVSDTGEVIPADKIDNITKPFGLGKDHYDKDIGLGLAYIQRFLDLHDASLEITSSIEKTNIAMVFKMN